MSKASTSQITAATEADWLEAQLHTKRLKYITMMVAAVVLPAMSFPALLLATRTANGAQRYLFTVIYAAGFLLPLIYLIFRISIGQQTKNDRMIGGLTGQLSAAVDIADARAAERNRQADRQIFEQRLANALDMAHGEPEVIDVIERSFQSALPQSPVELLLADNSHAHLLRKASSSPGGIPPGCSVDSPDQCPSARRAQVQRFGHSNDLDACPKLRNRPGGEVSALCVPVSIMGRTVGVIHATNEANVSFCEDKIDDLGTLAKLAGARLGLLRVIAETQLQAGTDSLTGLMNRRSFEQAVSTLRRHSTDMSVAVADLDHFKALNDAYGHDTGDRALRLFAKILRDSVRAADLVCRHGGEEFVIALARCPAEQARQILNNTRTTLAAAHATAGLPHFTASFGIVEATCQEDLPQVIGRADAALFQAKHQGRNRAVVHDTAGQPIGAPTEAVALRG